MNLEETLVIDGLRNRGYAITIFNPDELRGADPGRVEEIMCINGWAAIDNFATEEEQE